MRTTNVQNMVSPRTGKPVANQFIIETEKGEYFQSYKTTICLRLDNGLDPVSALLDDGTSGYGWDYSNTTRRYLYQFLGVDSKKDILEGLKSGKYQLANLNG